MNILCSICIAQVLLSCSHTFHAVCLSSFERHSGSRSCPVCRREQYQKKGIDDGLNAYKVTCAIKIQAVARGFLARQLYTPS